jgi:hypothetical protein
METARPGQRVFLSAASYGNVRQEKTKLDINFNLLAKMEKYAQAKVHNHNGTNMEKKGGAT